jgi:cell division protein FtsB
LIALGGYVWTETITRIGALEDRLGRNEREIAVLQSQTDQQRATNLRLETEVGKLNSKLDQVLYRMREPNPRTPVFGR